MEAEKANFHTHTLWRLDPSRNLQACNLWRFLPAILGSTICGESHLHLQKLHPAL